MGLAATIRQWQSNRARAHELAALDPSQRDVLARDIGVAEDVLSSLLARGPQAGTELPRLMETLGLDADRIGRSRAALTRDMSITCTQCAAVARCRRDIDLGRAPSTHGAYCPNAETLRELRVEGPADGIFV